MTARRRRPPRVVVPAPSVAPVPPWRSWLGRQGWLIWVCVVMIFAAFVRLRLANVPLERDEGEYGYAGQLILQGVPPYQLAYNMKFPGTYYAYSLILAVFGQTAWGIHVGLLFVNAATTVLLLFLGRRMIGRFGASVAATAFALLSLDRWIMGVFAHATHFVLLPAVAGLLVLSRAVDSRRSAGFLWAGVLLGIAVLMKQHAVLLLPFAFGLSVWSETREPGWRPGEMARRGGLLVIGVVIPLAALCAVLAMQGVLPKFWFWTFHYAREYVSQTSLSDGWDSLVEVWQGITRANLSIWLTGGAGMALLWAVPWAVEARVVLTGLLVSSFLAMCPGLYFRAHYFILLLPAVALGVGVAVASAQRLLSRMVGRDVAYGLAAVAFLALAGSYVSGERNYLFSMTPRDVSRSRYGLNPFIEAVDIGAYIRERTSPDERIAVLGSEPEIYFYAQRKSVTGYIYTYPLMEPQKFASQMQHEMMQEVEAGQPAYVVLVGYAGSWTARPNSDKTVIEWAQDYSTQCNDLVGVADVQTFDKTAMRWDAEAARYETTSKDLVYTLRRRSKTPCHVSR